ncbi:MAG: hypothetical protein PF501_16345 [Salinisphaera sp.]|jgi:carboxypeptidase C (cathepsin A)|nr:hypothetical protein [Salinisphaera sp.]
MNEHAIDGESPKQPERPADIVTRHSLVLDGETIDYTATVGSIDVSVGDHAGRIFYIAYVRNNAASEAPWPLTFAYNGGPGSSSSYVHMGGWSPKRIEVRADAATPPAPYTLIDNPNTLLGDTDLVFIDPIGTGYSHVLGDAPSDAFFGVEVDIESIGDVIRRYVTVNQRWNSPKFLAGESYGTTRSAFLVDYLQTTLGMAFNGVVLVSSILNFEADNPNSGNDLPYPLVLPTYAATAWYYDRLASSDKPDDLPTFLDEVREFASNEYASALMKGDLLPEAEREHVVKRLAAYTGLTPEYCRLANLRISQSRFRKELLRDESRVLGRYDTRYSGGDLLALDDFPDYDPTNAAINGAFTAAINEHLTRNLGVTKTQPYVTLSDAAIAEWKWQPGVAGYNKAYYIDAASNLRDAMIRNPYLRVLFVGGRHDLATPFYAAEYTVSHMNLPAELRDHVEFQLYASGHMVYLRDPEQQALNHDMRDFMHRAIDSQTAAQAGPSNPTKDG